MPKRKIHPYRLGYRAEPTYPSKRGRFLVPYHGSGPRCRVDHDHNPSNDGPWSTLQIMRVEEKDQDEVEVEEYTCAMPRYYAVPLILMNKRLTFFEASCRPDGTPLTPTFPVSPPPPPTPTAINTNGDNGHDDGGGVSGGGRGVAMVTLPESDLREYSYLWRLRTQFLQAIFDMNHQRRLDERWRYERIHGFVHRLYRRYGHDDYQRLAYWKDEVKAGRVPYATPDIADMDWQGHILKDMSAASGSINAFLWNRVSQGYPRAVKDEPPQEGWRAWRRGSDAARDVKPVLFRTPACTPVRELPRGLDSEPMAVEGQSTQTQSKSQSQSRPQSQCGNRDVGRADDAPPVPPVAAAAAAATAPSTSQESVAAAAVSSRCARPDNNRDDDVDSVDTIGTMGYEVVLTETLNGPPHTQVWQLPFLADQGTTSTTSRQGRRSPLQVAHNFAVPEHLKLTAINYTFSHVEDVGDDFQTQLKVTYASKKVS